MSDQNFFAHDRGWTILVVHDCGEDDDWNAQGVVGPHFSVPDYVEANEAAPLENYFWGRDWFPAKEHAYSAAGAEIDRRLRHP